MSTAVLYDVHGNLAALEAVLHDAAEREVTEFVLGGDYAAFGPRPVETLARLRELPNARWIRGNTDRWLAGERHDPIDELTAAAIDAGRELLSEAACAELGRLPVELVEGNFRLCHASPRSDMAGFTVGPDPADERLLAGCREWCVLFGHTHLQFRRTGPRGVELINPGSVGFPYDSDPRAAYATIDEAGEVALHRVAYDHEAVAEDLAWRFGDAEWAQRSARRLLAAAA